MPDNASLLEGGCTCGEIRYRLESEPLFVNCCHCSWCQRETGSAFVLNAMIEADRVTLLRGVPVMVPTPSLSGKGQKIWRCEICRVALWSNYSGAGDKVHFVRVGTLDDPGALPPDAHIFTTTKLPWVRLPDDVPVFQDFYDPGETWPQDTLDRMRALRRQE
ncbi:GFA family protein [Nisaea sediminum]|uniref:GFA family protein n=1 Tax=Nisaea sediminum TaxID=2775867 RepID=UPI001D0082CC|nr:GFA family protein [Nisaea sediminum]